MQGLDEKDHPVDEADDEQSEGEEADDWDQADDEADDRKAAEEHERVRRVPLDVRVVLADEQEDQARDPAHEVGEDRVSLLVAAYAARGRRATHGCRLAGWRWWHLRHRSINLPSWLNWCGQIID